MPATEVPLTVTYIRASTVLIRWAGRSILTDAWFGDRMRFLPALRRPGVPLSAIPCPDLSCCSHLHADHFEPNAIRRLAGPQTVIVGPVGMRSRLKRCPGIVHEMSSDETLETAGLMLTAWPVPHTFPPPDELCFLLEDANRTVFFAGDAGYGPIFRKIGTLKNIELALLPVGGSLIMGRQTVMGPLEAYQAALDLQARSVIPIHPGGDWPSLPPLSRHPGQTEDLVRLADDRNAPFSVVALSQGETTSINTTTVP